MGFTLKLTIINMIKIEMHYPTVDVWWDWCLKNKLWDILKCTKRFIFNSKDELIEVFFVIFEEKCTRSSLTKNANEKLCPILT